MTNNKQTHYNYSALTDWQVVHRVTPSYYYNVSHYCFHYYWLYICILHWLTTFPLLVFPYECNPLLWPYERGLMPVFPRLACIPIRGWLTATQRDVSGEGGGGWLFLGAEGDLMERVPYKQTYTSTLGLRLELFTVCTPQPLHGDMYCMYKQGNYQLTGRPAHSAVFGVELMAHTDLKPLKVCRFADSRWMCD